MMTEPTAKRWTRIARVFHWTTLVLIIIQIPLGLLMVEVYEVYTETYADDTWVMRTSLVHHTLGFTILGVTLSRFGWRMSHPAPALPASLESYQRWLARLTHICLYLLLIIYPLSGWASLSAYEGEFPIFFLASTTYRALFRRLRKTRSSITSSLPKFTVIAGGLVLLCSVCTSLARCGITLSPKMVYCDVCGRAN